MSESVQTQVHTHPACHSLLLADSSEEEMCGKGMAGRHRSMVEMLEPLTGAW